MIYYRKINEPGISFIFKIVSIGFRIGWVKRPLWEISRLEIGFKNWQKYIDV